MSWILKQPLESRHCTASCGLLLLALSALAGCQQTAFVLPQLEVPQGWHRDQTVDLSSSELWRAEWQGPLAVGELQRLIDEALLANSDLRIAIERIELARAQYGIERAAVFPVVSANAGFARERMPGFEPQQNKINESGSVGVSIPAWEIDLWGRLASRTEAVRREVLADAALADGVRVSLIADVSLLYLDLLDLDAQQEVTRSTLASRQRALRLIRIRFDEGISSILDVRQAESALATAEQVLAEQARRVAQTENSLQQLLRRNPGSVARTVRLDDLPLPVRLNAGLPSDLLLQRPDIRAAEEALRSAGASVEAARKEFLPRITLTTLFGFASSDLAALFSSGRKAWSLQPAISLPLFDTGRRRAGVELAEAQQRILVEHYKGAVRQAFREVSDTLVAFGRLTQQRAATLRMVQANRERLRVTNARYLSGIANYFEVLDAERQLLDSELALTQRSRELQQTQVQLYRALGGSMAVWSVPG